MSQTTVSIDGETWRILGIGATKTDDEGRELVLCHLASTTRFRQQRNGANPIQMCDWVPSKEVFA